jgi:hypothetical protein
VSSSGRIIVKSRWSSGTVEEDWKMGFADDLKSKGKELLGTAEDKARRIKAAAEEKAREIKVAAGEKAREIKQAVEKKRE